MHLLWVDPIFFLLTQHLTATLRLDMWNGNSYLSRATPSLLLRTRAAFQLHGWPPRAKITFPSLPHVSCDPVPKCWPKRNAPKGMCNSWGLPLKGRSVPSPSCALLFSDWNAHVLGSHVGPSRSSPAPMYQERSQTEKSLPTWHGATFLTKWAAYEQAMMQERKTFPLYLSHCVILGRP